MHLANSYRSFITDIDEIEEKTRIEKWYKFVNVDDNFYFIWCNKYLFASGSEMVTNEKRFEKEIENLYNKILGNIKCEHIIDHRMQSKIVYLFGPFFGDRTIWDVIDRKHDDMISTLSNVLKIDSS